MYAGRLASTWIVSPGNRLTRIGIQADRRQLPLHPQGPQEPREQAVRVETRNAVHGGIEGETPSVERGE